MKTYPGKKLKGKVASLHMGNNEDLSKQSYNLLTAGEEPVIRLL